MYTPFLDLFTKKSLSMKLRLPNKLVTAIMAAASPVLFQTFSTATVGIAALAAAGQQATAFNGPDVTYTGSATVTKSNMSLTLTQNTAITVAEAVDQGSGNIVINGSGYDIKITGASDNDMLDLGKVTANSVWFANGRFRIDEAAGSNHLFNGAKVVYVGGSQLWFTDSANYTGDNAINSNFVLGNANINEGYTELDYSALRIGRSVDINGSVTIDDEGSKISFQNAESTLTLKGNLLGNGNLLLSTYWNSATRLNVLGDTSNYHGSITVTQSNTTLNFGGGTAAAPAVHNINGITTVGAVAVADNTTLVLTADSSLKSATLGVGSALKINAGATVTLTEGTGAAALLANISGDGNITVAQNTTMANGAASLATGTLTVQGTSSASVKLQVRPNNSNSSGVSSFSAYELDNATLETLNLQNVRSVVLNKLTVKGNSALGSAVDGSCYNGSYSIGTLIGSTESTLNIYTGSQVSWASTFHFNGGEGSDFHGDVILEIKNNADAQRRVLMDINSGAATQLQDSVITFESTNRQGKRDLGLGINTNATIRGLKSGTYGTHYLFSGAATDSLNEAPASGNIAHTLTIGHGAEANDSYTFTGKVLGNLNLVKEGSGTQIFSGDMSAFNGSVVVNAGSLELTNGLPLNSTAWVNGGNLTLGGTVTVDADTPLKYALYTGSEEAVPTVSYSNGSNGFLSSGTQYRYFAHTTGDGSVTLNDGFALRVGDAVSEYTKVSDGYVFAAASATSSIYYVNTDLSWANVGSTTNATAFCVADGKTFNAKGSNLAGLELILNHGSTFATTEDDRFSIVQMKTLTLNGDATLDVSRGIVGVIGSGFNGGTVNLNGHKLSIIGSGKGVSLAETAMDAGTISVGEGAFLQVVYNTTGATKTVSANNAVLELADGAALRIGGNSTIKIKGINNTGTGTAAITCGTNEWGAAPTGNVNGGKLELTAAAGEVYNYKGTLAGLGTGAMSELKMTGAGTQNFELISTAQLNGLVMSAGKLNFSGALVSVGSRVDIGYSSGSGEVVFANGLKVTGNPSNGYALVIGGSSKVTLGGISEIEGYNIGVSSNGELIIDRGAQITANHFYNSANSNGKLTVLEDASVTFTNTRTTNNSNNIFQELTNAGAVTFSGSLNTTISALSMSGGSLTKSGTGEVSATLKSGQTILGGRLVNTNTGLLKININNNVELTGGYNLGNSIDATWGAGSSGRLELNVAENATVTLKGAAEGTAYLDKSGAGDLVINAGSVANALYRAKSGMLTLKSDANAAESETTQIGAIFLEGGNSTLNGGHFTIGGTNNYKGLFVGSNGGQLSLVNGASATLYMGYGQDWQFQIAGSSDASKGVRLETGSSFTVNTNYEETLVVSNNGTADATISASQQVDYTVGNANVEIKNADVSLSKASAVELGNKLTNSFLTNSGAGTLTASNSDNTLKGVHAEGGSVLVQNAAFSAASLESIKATGGNVNLLGLEEADAALKVTLKDLTIADNKTVGAYRGDSVPATAATANEAIVSLGGTLTAGSGATLNANLEVQGGSKLDFAAGTGNDGLHMGSSLTLGTGTGKINLSESMNSYLATLGLGDRLTLFTGVDALYLGATDAEHAYSGEVSASDYFNLVALTNPEHNLVLTYSGADDGIVSLAVVPEPATATLSLLALAGLAARRRRK